MKQPEDYKRQNLALRQAFSYLFLIVFLSISLLWLPKSTEAQPAAPSAAPPPVAVPGFWDPRRRPERPDTSRITQIRFLTEFDYPPFNYAGPDGNPAGFNVEVARLICEELKIQCTIQLRRFDTLLQALGENRADAVIASLAVTPETRQRVDFSEPYYRAPARFVARRDTTLRDVVPEGMEGKKIAVVAGTAHEAYLKAFFTEAELKPYPQHGGGARRRCARARSTCCSATASRSPSGSTAPIRPTAVRSSAARITESRYFGEGVGIAVRRGNDTLRLAFNWALFRLWEKGRFTDLWLRYFPISPF